MIRDIVLEDRRTKRRPCSCEQVEVLEQKRHAGEGTFGKALRNLPLSVVVVLHHHRIDLRIHFCCALDRFSQELLRGDLTPANEVGEADPIISAIVLEAHGITRGYQTENRPVPADCECSLAAVKALPD